MKFCKDCKWKRESTKELGSWICASPKLPVSLVDGVPIFTYCVESRHGKAPSCGPTAKWYEEKEKPIPECNKCKHALVLNYHDHPFDKTVVCNKLSPPSTSSVIEKVRLNESLCGKYGKWFKKKDVPTFNGIPINFDIGFAEKPGSFYVLPPIKKKQSWLCRLICGRNK